MTKVLSRSMGAWLAAMMVGALAAACSTDPQVAKQEHFARGQEYLAEKKYHEAIIELRNAVQIDPRFGEARYQLADAYAQVGDGDNAFREYVRAADLLPDPKVQLKAGMLLLLSGRHEDAKGRAEKVLAGDPGNIEAHILLGNALAGMKDFDAAVDQMQRAIKTDPNPGLSYASLGNFELQRGNRSEAEAAFAKAIELDPASAPARVALGNYRLATDDRAQAEAAFLKALELDPRSVIALRSTVALYLTSRQLDRAEPFLLRLVDETKDSTPVFVLADVYTATGRIELAVDKLRALQKNQADALPATLRLAAIAYATGKTDEGHVNVDQAIKLSPKAPHGYVMKGRFFLSERKLADAATQLRTAVANTPDYAPAHYWLGETHLQEGKLEEARAAFLETLKLTPTFVPALVSLSAIHLRQREADAALTYATQAVTGAPRDADARAALVRVLLAQRNLPRAEAEMKTLTGLAGDVAAVHVLRGAVDMLRKDPKSAEQAFARALEINPRSADALNGLVTTQLASGQVAAAQAKVDEAVTQSPGDAATLLIAARAHLAARDFASAERTLRQVIETDPQRLDAYTMLGRLYATQNRLDDAIREFDEIAKRRPKSVGAHTAVATLQLALNRRAEAKARYQKVIDIDANAAVAANNLAWIQAEDGDNLDVALQLAKTAVRGLPGSAEVNDTLGFVHYKKKQYPEAIKAFQSSLKIDTRNPIYLYHLGLAYHDNGDTADARRALSAALKLSPTFAGSDEARATLASLR